MTLIEHLAELRTRLFVSIVAWIVAAGVAFGFRFNLLEWLRAPLPDGFTLNAFGVLEPFLVSMNISAFFGVVLAAPVIGLQVWLFIAPALYAEEKRWSVPFVFFTAGAFATGVMFARYVVLPLALPILLGFLGNEANVLLSIGDYISKLILYMAVFGILFEMPVLAFLLARLGFIYAPMMRQYRRYAIVGGCVAAAVVTPTGDPFNFALVAVPLVVLYELSILIVRFSQKRPLERAADPLPLEE
ncbi:MAG: twin-arginine translocase subunit TatC [Deinococcota bacterium]